ncbi:beta-ketoacyl synthase N-terminal-like domain-containing protein, partial [Janthinobacterium sp.]|uniref:beta-ketoacyl synthase N-terminal-like domain-containing protein n=1 Tax=Janthinobacterium sp. TaxID=1871054 RepID=UPI0025845FD8
MESAQQDMDAMLLQLLYGLLQSVGVVPEHSADARQLRAAAHIADAHGRWLDESLQFLEQAGLVRCNAGQCQALAGTADLDDLWRQWDARKRDWQQDAVLHSRVPLVEATLKALPDIVRGRRPATDVVFPDASMRLVEGIYRDNPVSAQFNELLAQRVEEYVAQRLRDDAQARIRILEIGAGTGGTSAALFKRLARFGDAIAEYCYTDVSKAFLLHAEQAFRATTPYLSCRIFDVCEPLAAQGLSVAGYDLVIATNVLHATADISRSVRNAKAALRPHGLLMLNELSDKRLYAHLTFGLLDGWWMYQDAALRIAGCPVLSPDAWRFVLEQEGFRQIAFPASDLLPLGQQIIVAASDGAVRAIKASGKTPAQPAPRAAQPVALQAAAPPVSSLAQQAIAHAITECIAAVLRIAAVNIDPAEPFSHYGLDSILGVGLVRLVNQRLGTSLNTTSIFDYRCVHELAAHIALTHPVQDDAASPAAEHAPQTMTLGDIEAALRDCLSSVLRVDARDIDITEAFSAYGLDSILGVRFVRLVNERMAAGLTTTSIFDYSTVRAMAAHLFGSQPRRAAAAAPARDTAIRLDTATVLQAVEAGDLARTHAGPIAIIGMSGRYAQSRNLAELWQHLEQGRNLVGEATRWDLPRQAGGTQYCSQGSFVDGIAEFDPLFFNISGIEASYMDPQQRIFLEQSWTALEDAGYAGSAMDARQCGVYAGCGNVDYADLLPATAPAHSMWGTASSIIPARIAYYLNLQGPAIAVDTACSSSLVAIHLACQGLWSGEIDMALAGGVFLMCTPQVYTIANRAAMLSPQGQCFAFDDRADGFVPGEGAGVVVLKRLSDAVADGDHIYGVICGSGINQDGATNGITAPSALSQERLERKVYDAFALDPAGFQMMEAHGTGTKLGDPIEYQALTKAFRAYTDKQAYCALGSIKTNLGHTTAAAGVTGLLKILLALQHRKIPASLNYQSGNAHIASAGSPFFINTELRDWVVEPGTPRRAALSSFGFSGTNAHLVVEQAPPPPCAPRDKPAYLIVLSAKSAEQLQAMVRNLRDHCQQSPQLHCANLSFTLLLGRQHFSHRFACVVHSVAALLDIATQWLDKGALPQVRTARLDDRHLPDQPALKRYGNQCLSDCAVTMAAEPYLEQLHAVAELYIQGYALDYTLLFAGERHQRLPLPTYPFARESYWLPSQPSRADGATGASHPLVQRNISSFSVQRYAATLDGGEFFLADHIVHGNKMLPGVAYLEMAHEAVRLASDIPGAIRLSKVLWARPLTVDAQPLEVRIALLPQNDGSIRYEISTETDGQPVLHSHGLATVESAAEQPPRIDLGQLKRDCNRQMPAEHCYALYQGYGLHYGPSHRAIESLYVGEQQVLARLVLPAPLAATRGQFALHPSLLDAA